MTKRIVIWSLVILGLLLIVLAIIFGPYIALTLALLFGRKEDDFDAEKYRGYICMDSNLACISASEESANAYITFSGGRSYDFTYRKAEDVSDDQFIVVSMRNSAPLSMKEKYVFQNPENPVDVWTDWTVKEIQVYYLDINQLPDSVLEEHDPPKTPTGIVATIGDAACIAELLDFATGDEYPSLSTVREETDSAGGFYGVDLDGDSSLYVRVYVRVIFQESESIVWDSEIQCYENFETGERIVTLRKDTTVWDENANGCGIDFKEFCVKSLPDLEAFLLNAVNGLAEALENHESANENAK